MLSQRANNLKLVLYFDTLMFT